MAANDNSPAQDVAAPVLYSVYEPLTGPAGEEIPAFTIYCDGAPVAFTDAALPRDEQEHTARTFLAMHVMLESHGPDHRRRHAPPHPSWRARGPPVSPGRVPSGPGSRLCPEPLLAVAAAQGFGLPVTIPRADKTVRTDPFFCFLRLFHRTSRRAPPQCSQFFVFRLSLREPSGNEENLVTRHRAG